MNNSHESESHRASEFTSTRHHYIIHITYHIKRSQQESVARNAAERDSDRLIKAAYQFTPSPVETKGWEFHPLRPVVVSCGAFVCFMSRHWVGRARTKSVLWLVTSRVGLQKGELLDTFSAAYAFSQGGGRQRRRLWVPVSRELRLAASLIFLAHRDLSAPWCSEVSLFVASPCDGAVVASISAAVLKDTGDRWRFSRRQEFDAAPRSVVERTHLRSAQRSAQSSRRRSHRQRSTCHP